LPWWENIKIDCDIKRIYEDPDPCLKFYYETILLPAYNSTYHGNVLALFGGDFHYQSETNFDYIDKFIELLNERSEKLFGIKINAFYSSVNDYFDHLKTLNLKFHTYVGDFVPYVEYFDHSFDYWTGFYTTFPALKTQIKQTF